MNQMDTKRDLTFEELCETVAPIAEKHGIMRVYLFGSRARGDSNADSDYDFCIAAPKGYGLFRIGSFLSDLEEVLGTSVDAVSEDAVFKDPYFKEEMMRERRIVFET